jgi:hypothetical protein
MTERPHSLAPRLTELREELLQWLRGQNAAKPWAWLDRPIVVTFVGGLILALLAHKWDIDEKAREREFTQHRAVLSEQQNLLRELGNTFMNTVQVSNAWFSYVIWIAQERPKEQSDVRKENINKWGQQIQKLQEQYSMATPLDPTLVRVGILYRCEAVKETASDMSRIWDAFLDMFQSFNRESNANPLVPAERAAKADESRAQLLDQLQDLEGTLLEKMSAEISAGVREQSECPP